MPVTRSQSCTLFSVPLHTAMIALTQPRWFIASMAREIHTPKTKSIYKQCFRACSVSTPWYHQPSWWPRRGGVKYMESTWTRGRQYFNEDVLDEDGNIPGQGHCVVKSSMNYEGPTTWADFQIQSYPGHKQLEALSNWRRSDRPASCLSYVIIVDMRI